jgi:3-dehydroquinate dehydratase I
MICVSVAEESLAGCLAAVKDITFGEIRVDRTALTAADVGVLFSSHPNLIATCRPGTLPDDLRKTLLLVAIDAGAAFVDVEVDAPDGYREEIEARAGSRGCAVIVSFHDHEGTPDRQALDRVVSECFRKGADIAKIACMAHTGADNARLLGLLDDKRKIVVIGMGEKGKITRLVAPLLGSPFTFASVASGKETADGQIDHKMLQRALSDLGPMASGEGRP